MLIFILTYQFNINLNSLFLVDFALIITSRSETSFKESYYFNYYSRN